ncbi:MAG: DNA repair protein RadA [Ruminococcaceae bacterium]|nr:DNA repair protein RadA [Oscillospiraceae bacterium]
MASKQKTVYICNNCGYESAKWYGKCPSCSEWGTMDEEIVKNESKSTKTTSSVINKSLNVLKLDSIDSSTEFRFNTGISELNRVLGGGLVKGSLVLLSGDPGIGKSTLLLQICNYLSKDLTVLYVSGEESAYQLKMRAKRLGVKSDNLSVMCETDAEIVCEYIKSAKPNIVMVDSIQTMNISEISSSTGSITQVRECTNLFMQTSKNNDISTILVGHVNKDGNIAGPKVLEHIVDTVLYFEGERNYSYRILRAAKNRFGSTNEIGVFEMTEMGLSQIESPSMALLAGRPTNVSGTCVTCMIEGSRPILAEIQGLATTSGFGNPRRMSTGFDYNRMAMLIAILEKRAGYFFSNMDCYLNIVGGLRADEPASDLAVAVALISSLKDAIIDSETIVFGEIGLAGEIRMVNNCEQRIKESERLGFKRCIIPRQNMKKLNKASFTDIEVIGVRNVREAFEVAIENA